MTHNLLVESTTLNHDTRLAGLKSQASHRWHTNDTQIEGLGMSVPRLSKDCLSLYGVVIRYTTTAKFNLCFCRWCI